MYSPLLLGQRLLRVPSKLRRLIAVRRLSARYAAEDPGMPTSDVPLDVLIPVIAKDLPILPICVSSIRRFVRHPVRRIYLIARPDAQIAAVAKELNIEVRDENELLSDEARALRYTVGGRDRSGWIKQQLVKISGERLAGTERFLVVDADTAFVRDIVFCRGGRDVLFCGDVYFNPYYDAYRRLMGLRSIYGLTFVAQHMLFNPARLLELRQLIERQTNRRWDLAILDQLDPDLQSCFSEYEMYGNFCYWTHQDEMTVRYWHNKSLSCSQVPSLDDLINQHGKDCFTVSLHSYLREQTPA